MAVNASLVASFAFFRVRFDVSARSRERGYNGKWLENASRRAVHRGNEISRTRARCALMNSS